MKTKKRTLGLITVIGILSLISVAAMYTPNGSQVKAQVCQLDPMRCVIPQNVSKFPLGFR